MKPPVERTDAQVVRDVLSGDRDAYRLLVRRYGDVLHGHALRMTGSADEAADLVQRAFVKGFKKLGRCREPERVGAWLFRILANLCKDHARSPRRSDVPVTAMEGVLRSRSDPETDAEGTEIRTRVWGALEALTPERARRIGQKARQRMLDEPTYAHRALQLERLLSGADQRGRRGRRVSGSPYKEGIT